MDDSPILARRYRLDGVVGRGGMADVHRATDLLLDRAVAVKVLRDPAGDQADAARFTAEARTLAGLDHRGLVTVLDAGVDDGRPFLVMELVDGPTLRLLVADRSLTPRRLADIGAQVADALAHVHRRGVVHRDVKPGNILLTADDRALLADFGIARLVGDTVRHTVTGQTIGTAAYLAPEQVLGEEPTPAVDVYALGLVLLEALTGERAFTGSPTEAALARLHRRPALPASLTPSWRHLVSAMTAQEPARRPTADQVASELRRIGSDPSTPGLGLGAGAGLETVAMAAPTVLTAHRRRGRAGAARDPSYGVPRRRRRPGAGGLRADRDHRPGGLPRPRHRPHPPPRRCTVVHAGAGVVAVVVGGRPGRGRRHLRGPDPGRDQSCSAPRVGTREGEAREGREGR